MISQLKGTVDCINLNKVTLDVSGVGYEVICSAACLRSIGLGDQAKIVVYTHVREDALVLFGFEDALEKQVFLLLHSVQGVGPRSAAEIVSGIDKIELLRAIGQGDASRLQKLKGVGKKLSERIIVELKDKVTEFVQGQVQNKQVTQPVAEAGSIVEDAISAFIALGFSRKDAERAIGQAAETSEYGDSGILVRDALRFV